MKIGSNRMNILPKTLKKRSDYAASWTRSEVKSTPVTSGYAAMQQFDRVTIVPNEDWIVTETGSESPKVSGKGYETYSQIINPGVTTSKVWHATKDRTVHVIEGYGKLWTKNTVAVEQEVILVPGTFVELKAGTAYRFVVEESCLSLLVVQSTKYNSKLETLEGPSFSKVKIRPAGKRASKAVEQQQLRASKRADNSSTVVLPNGKRTKALPPERMSQVAGINALPTGGVFDEGGAG